MVDKSNDETKLSHKLLITNTQVSRICKAFANDSSANINFSEPHLSKMIQFGGFNLFSFMLNAAKVQYSEVQNLASKVQVIGLIK